MRRSIFLLPVMLVALLVSLIVGAVRSVFWLFTDDVSGKSVISVAPSPSRSRSVILFKNDCGATSAFSIQAALVEGVFAGGRSELSDVVFVADSDHGKVPVGDTGVPDLRVDWVTDDSLRLTHHPEVRVFRAEKRRGRLSIDYRRETPGAHLKASSTATD